LVYSGATDRKTRHNSAPADGVKHEVGVMSQESGWLGEGQKPAKTFSVFGLDVSR
jgi:hypothetical protein